MDTSLESADNNVDLRNNNTASVTSGLATSPSDGGVKTSRHHHLHSYHHQPRYQQNRLNQSKEGTNATATEGSVEDRASSRLSQSFDTQTQPGMAYQHKHALHRLRRLKKRSPHRDLVISFVPRLRTSIINRLDFFHRYSKQEQEVLSCFDFLDELVLNYCDGGLQESPRCSQKLYLSMIYELI